MTPSHPALELLDRRRSVPALQLGEPGPDEATLLRMLASAVRVPDHGRLVPFRFLRIQGPARAALGRFMAERLLQRDPQAPPSQVEKALHRFASAPLVLAVVARLQAGHKVPEQEQLLTAGCVCFALLQAAQACGFGAQWLTGWMAYDREVTRHLGLAGNEQVVGFIHIGTPRQQAPERERPDPRQLLTDWTP